MFYDKQVTAAGMVGDPWAKNVRKTLSQLLVPGVDARHLFEDHASGAKDDGLGLNQALTFVRPGDVLVVCKLGWPIADLLLENHPSDRCACRAQG